MTRETGVEDVTGAIAAFVDALLPGDEVFPSASAVGAHGVLVMRLRETVGAGAAEALAAAFTQPRRPRRAAGRRRRCWRRKSRALFETALTVLYYAYYETPAVIAAIRSLGIVYNDAPQPEGYAMRPFDPALDLPAEKRGRFVPTDAVARVDLSALGLLDGGGPLMATGSPCRRAHHRRRRGRRTDREDAGRGGAEGRLPRPGPLVHAAREAACQPGLGMAAGDAVVDLGQHAEIAERLSDRHRPPRTR